MVEFFKLQAEIVLQLVSRAQDLGMAVGTQQKFLYRKSPWWEEGLAKDHHVSILAQPRKSPEQCGTKTMTS